MGRNDLVSDSAASLDQAGHAGRGLCVANVRLDRTQGCRWRHRCCTSRCHEGLDLDRITHARAGPMPFEIPHSLNSEACPNVRAAQCEKLAIDLRPCETA